MNTLKFYKKDGNLYTFKNQPVFISILTIVFLAGAVFVYRLGITWLFFSLLAVAVLIIANFFAKKLIIDMDRLTVTGKHSVFVPAKTYPIENFTNFEIFTTKYWGLIITNVILSAHFEVDGKNKKLTIGQAVTQRGIQNMVNETEDIMNINDQNNERNRPL